jgi:hypothetical protein
MMFDLEKQQVAFSYHGNYITKLQDPEAYGSVSILPTFRDAIIFDP